MTNVMHIIGTIGLALTLSAQPAAQQDRHAFSGTVVDSDGIPVPDLEIHCDWMPNAVQLGQPDRASARTSASGEFSIDLLVGRRYCVWACGKTRGASAWAIEPRFRGLAGARSVIVARQVGPSGPVRIRGLAAWRGHQPLKLRVWGSRSSVMSEIGLVEDGFHELPPLPSAEIVLDLVASDGQTLVRSPLHLDREREFDVGDTVELRLEVVDRSGKHVPGAAVLERTYTAHAFAPPLTWGLPNLSTVRTIATTDQNGRATGRIRRPGDGDPTLIFAAREDSASPYSGWMSKRAFGGARGNPDGAALDARLVVARVGDCEVDLEGWTEDRGLYAVLHGSQRAEAGETLVGSFMDISSLHTVSAGSARVRALTGGGARWRIAGCWDGGDGRPRAVNWSLPCGSGKQVVKFDPAQELKVEVVDERGAPAPFATVGLSRGIGDGSLERVWDALVVTSKTGEASIVASPGDGHLYAVGDDAHGLVGVEARDKVVRVVLEPFVKHGVTVVDSKGSPIAGILLEVFVDGDDEKIGLLARYALEGDPAPFRGKVTDQRGQCWASMPPELVEGGSLAVVFDGRTHHVGPLNKSPFVIPR